MKSNDVMQGMLMPTPPGVGPPKCTHEDARSSAVPRADRGRRVCSLHAWVSVS